MNALAKLNSLGPVSSKLAAAFAETPDVTAAIGASYGVVKYKGKVWSIDYRGKTQIVERADEPGTPANAIEVVFVDVSLVKSKIYYPQGYAGEGSSEKPACWSSNGVSPAAGAPEKQATACAVCPKNVSGSRIDENGVARGKACRDNIRVAVVPIGDIHNQSYGGPMLMRIPAASLADYADCMRQLQGSGIPFFGVVMKVKFDPTVAYPKMVFEPQRHLSDAEADVVLALRDDPQTKRIVSEEPSQAEATPAPLALPGQPSAKLTQAAAPVVAPPAPKAAPAAPKAIAPKPAPKTAPVAAPVEEEPSYEEEAATTGTSLDDELDALLS